MAVLTKTNYLNGLQCSKLLWISENAKEKLPKLDITSEYNIKQGILMGQLAKTLYPAGIDLESFSIEGNLVKTQELIEQDKPIFEAGFKYSLSDGDLFTKVDILQPVANNQWDIIEVKSSTKVKDIHIDDLGFQKYCLEKAGLEIRKCFLMLVNNEYKRLDEVEV